MKRDRTILNIQNKANFVQQPISVDNRRVYMITAGIFVGVVSVLVTFYSDTPVNFLFVSFTAFVFLLTLISPTLAMLAAIASTPFNEVFFLDIGVKIRLYEVMVLAMLAGWMLRTTTGTGKLRSLNHNPLMLALSAILIANILSLKNTASLSDSIIILGITIFLVLLYLLIYYHLYSVKIYKQALLVFIFASNLVAIYGIYQSVAYFAGINFCLGSAEKLLHWKPHLWGAGRAFSTFTEPVEFAAYTMACILFLIPLLNAHYFRRWKLYIAVSLTIQIIANLLAMSRTAWLGLVAGILLYPLLLCFTKEKSKILKSVRTVFQIISIIFLLSVLLAVFTPQIYTNLAGRTLQRDSYSTVSGRLKQLRDYCSVIPEHAFIGHGIGMGSEIGLKYVGFKTESRRGGSGPNVFISTLFQTGILGLVALIWLYLAFAGKTISALRQTDSIFFRPVLISSFMAITGLLLTYQMNYFFIQSFFWVYLALAMAAVRLSQVENKCLSK